MLGWTSSELWIWAWLVAEWVTLITALNPCHQGQLFQVKSKTGLPPLLMPSGPALRYYPGKVRPSDVSMAQTTALTKDIHIAIGGNRVHTHQRRPLLLQPQTQTQQQRGPGPHQAPGGSAGHSHQAVPLHPHVSRSNSSECTDPRSSPSPSSQPHNYSL